MLYYNLAHAAGDQHARTHSQTIEYLNEIGIKSDLPQPFYQEVNSFYLSLLSQKIDQAAQKVYEDLRSSLWSSQDHMMRVYTLTNQPHSCGKTDTAVAILQNASPFEQMIALEYWLHCFKPLPARHTFCFSNNLSGLRGRVIPLTVEKNSFDMMPVMLGNSGENTLAPKYDKWAKKDPWQSLKKENFIYHLEALEMVRQPAFIGATLIKGNAFESEYIDQDWRYGITQLVLQL